MRSIMVSLLALCFILNAQAVFADRTPSAVKEVKEYREIDSIQCDAMVEDTVKVGDTMNFYVSFTAKDAKARITDVNFWFWSDEDYNGDDALITFSPTKELLRADWIVENRSMKLMTSSDYTVRTAPTKSSAENILLKYEIKFNPQQPDGTFAPTQSRIVECARYRVTK